MGKKGFNILYVDDEEQNLISMKATFRKDYNVFTAKSGKEGLQVMKNNEIHMVVTDQRMPGMTGVEFLEVVVPEYPDTIRILLTGFSDVEAIIGAINSGRVFRYITKPWDENELRMTFENGRQLFDLQKRNNVLLKELKQKVEEQEKTLKLFMKYVPEAIVEQSLNNTNDTLLGGELRHVTVLFCDIRGFTNISEELSPKEVVSFLNDYYAVLTEYINQHNGSVTQFVGDEIFAVFGAPVASQNNEERAVFCALEMMVGIEKINEKYEEKLKREIKVGIGINSGEAIAGNLGCEDRIGYSVTGDTVNTGKRIESLTKDKPNSILISENVFSKVEKFIEYKEWEPLHVKGKKEKIIVYEVLGKRT